MESLNQQVKQFLTTIAQEISAIQKILLFGSRARGDFQEKSDFDVAIFGQLTFGDKLRIRDAVDEWSFVYKVDLIFWNELKDEKMRETILREGKVIVSKSEQKIKNFKNALTRLGEALATDLTDDIVLDAVIQRFEFTVELAWKALRTVLLDEGVSNDELSSPKAVVRSSFAHSLITDGEVWFAMLEARNITSHVYDLEQAEVIVKEIKNHYIDELKKLQEKLESEN